MTAQHACFAGKACLKRACRTAAEAKQLAAFPRAYATQSLSFRRGPAEPALYSGTIPEHFASIVARYGDRPAVIARAPCCRVSEARQAETTLTYHALDSLSNRLAQSLASLGVHQGDRVAVSLGNGAEFAALTYALFKLGAILVPLNPTFTTGQVQAALRHLGAVCLVIGAVADLPYKPGRGRLNRQLLESVVGDVKAAKVESEAVPTLRNVVIVDNLAYHRDCGGFSLEGCRALTPYAALSDGEDRPVKPTTPLQASDIINIQFTSGTTSKPKAAMLTHHSILNNGQLIAHRMGLDPTDRVVVPPPLYHCFGSVLGYMATATTGAAILFPSPAFDPAATLRMCCDADATGLYGVSTMLVAVMEALDAGGVVDHAPTGLRKGIVAGSSVPSALMDRIHRRLGLADLVICYGMTETSPVSCMTTPSDPAKTRTETVGRPMPHTAVKIVSSDDRRRVLPPNTRGELATAGYLVMQGYWNDAKRTAEVRVEEGSDESQPAGKDTPIDGSSNSPVDKTIWLYSGDEATMDEDGYVSITGRIKDLIIRGGENIHPLEIESCLFKHPGVQEVAVAGVPDERLGESVAAFVVPHRDWTTAATSNTARDEAGEDQKNSKEEESGARKLTRDSIRTWVRDRLSGHLVPQHVFWMEEFPKTASGKIQKFKLRDLAERKLSK